MAETTTTLVWKENENTGANEAFVGDTTNPAFTVAEIDGKFHLESHITGGNKTESFGSLADAKSFADEFLVSKGVPQNGTQLGEEIFAEQKATAETVVDEEEA